MRRLTVSAAVAPWLLAAALCSAQVPLQQVDLPRPGYALSRFALAKGPDKVVFYEGLLLTTDRRVELSPEASRRQLAIGGGSFQIGFDKVSGRFSLDPGSGKAAFIDSDGDGLAPQMLSLPGAAPGGERPYRLALPRSFCYMDNGVVFYSSGAVQQAVIDDQKIAFYDDNADGFYDKLADTMTAGEIRPSNVFVPITDYISTGSAIFRIDGVSKDGRSAAISKYSGAAAKVLPTLRPINGGFQVAFTSDDARMSFVISTPPPEDRTARQPREFLVLPGRYRLLYGLSYDAEGRIVALVLPGRSAPISVAADTPAPISIGQVALEFEVRKSTISKKASRDAETETEFPQVSVLTGSFVFRGALGEEYRLNQPPESVAIDVLADDKRVMGVGSYGFSARDGAFSFTAESPATRDTPAVPLKGRHTVVVRFSAPGLAAEGRRDIDL